MTESRPRRSTHLDMPVAYAAVGASRDPDLLRFPPEGSTPYHEELLLGSGDERFLAATSRLMTWSAVRAAGCEVTETDRVAEVTYGGLDRDAAGDPSADADRDEYFGPDGEPFLTPGTAVTVVGDGDARRVLVLYTVTEEQRVGFAWGHCDEDGAVGEQRFVVERREDGSVWAVARGFLFAPRSGVLGMRGKQDLRAAIQLAKRCIEALGPGAASSAGETAADAADPAPADPAPADPASTDPAPAELASADQGSA